MNFTEEQEKIIHHINGFILVVACPGSGKTTTMLERIQYMITQGIDPTKIRMVTFTKAAAEEMENRFKKNTGVNFSTIHSLCYEILSQGNFMPANGIVSEAESYNFFRKEIKGLVKRAELEDIIKNIITHISYVRNNRLNPQNYDCPISIFNYVTVDDVENFTFHKLYNRYELYKKIEQKLDYDDMLILTLQILIKFPKILEFWQNKMEYIIVDEFQDTNKIQANIFYLLSKKHGNLCAVGDDDQSMYGFRAADSSIMLKYSSVFPNCTNYSLSTNYRSGTEIIETAKNLISYNKNRLSKNFESGKQTKGKVVYEANDSVDLYKKMAAEIKQKIDNKEKPTDISILFRTNRQASVIINYLHKLNIPFSVKSSTGDIHKEFFFEDILAYYYLAQGEEVQDNLKIILNHPNRYLTSKAFMSCDLSEDSIRQCAMKHARNNGKYNAFKKENAIKSMNELVRLLKYIKNRTPSEIVKAIYTNEYKRWAIEEGKRKGIPKNEILIGIKTICEEALDFQNMEEWIDWLPEYAEIIKQAKKSTEGVVLTTFHGSKGLEWNSVYIVGADEGVTPSSMIDDSDEETYLMAMEEERRMFYVAVTRAKEYLKILSSVQHESRFVKECKIKYEESVNKDTQQTRISIQNITQKSSISKTQMKHNTNFYKSSF